MNVCASLCVHECMSECLKVGSKLSQQVPAQTDQTPTERIKWLVRAPWALTERVRGAQHTLFSFPLVLLCMEFKLNRR